MHFEVAGIESTFKDANPTTGTALAPACTSTKVGAGGIQLGGNYAILKNSRLDQHELLERRRRPLPVRRRPRRDRPRRRHLSLVHSGGAVEGFETKRFQSLVVYAYYGGSGGRDVASMPTAPTLIGYGYHGSANSQKTGR